MPLPPLKILEDVFKDCRFIRRIGQTQEQRKCQLEIWTPLSMVWQVHDGGNHEGLHTVKREKAFLLLFVEFGYELVGLALQALLLPL
jgi:hypothetical protein